MVTTLGLALTLSACTSEDAGTARGTAGTADDAALTSDDGLQGQSPQNGWLCEYVSPSAVDAAAGGKAVTPRSLTVQDDEKAWVCEVLSGGKDEQEPIVRLTIALGEEGRATAGQRAEAAQGVQPGPDYLGRSFISPGLVTGLTSCTAPKATDRSQQIPYTLVAEAFKVTTPEVTDDLRSALTIAAQGLDKSLGCSPKQASKDQAAATTAP